MLKISDNTNRVHYVKEAAVAKEGEFMIAKVASIYRSEYKKNEERNDTFYDDKKPQQTFCELLMVALRKKSLINKNLVDNNTEMNYTK